MEAFRLAAGGALLSPTQPTPRDKENCDPERNPEKPQNDFSLGICWRIWAHFFLTPARNSFSGLTNERNFPVPSKLRPVGVATFGHRVPRWRGPTLHQRTHLKTEVHGYRNRRHRAGKASLCRPRRERKWQSRTGVARSPEHQHAPCPCQKHRAAVPPVRAPHLPGLCGTAHCAAADGGLPTDVGSSDWLESTLLASPQPKPSTQ